MVIDSASLAPEHRLQVALLSQVDELPWTLELPVQAYARAETTPRGAVRRTVELIRFGDVSPDVIRTTITAHAGRDVRWGDAAVACADAFTCVVTRARMLDARTVELAIGEFPDDAARGASPCRALLVTSPGALEVSARKAAWGGTIQRSDAWLHPHPEGVERVVARHYNDAEAAERALDGWRIGSEGSPMVAGMPVEAEFDIVGSSLVQRVRVSWEELALIMEDHARVEALVALGAPAVVDHETQDLTQLEAVISRIDERIRALQALSGQERAHAAASTLVLIERALRVHANDERLSRRAYTLHLDEQGDGRAALAVADAMLKGTSVDPGSWEVARRAALARLDKLRLRRELSRVHRLNAGDALRMATSLVEASARGENYERAEWAWLTAHTLRDRAERTKWFEVPSANVELAVLVRALSVLMSAADIAGPLGVHVLAHGELSPTPPADAAQSQTWSGRVVLGKSKGLVLAATTSSEDELRALGQMLSASFEPGPLSLDLSFSPLSGPRSAQGPLLRVAGQHSSAGFVVERVSGALAAFDWDELSALVFAPLTRMSGRLFPPDELIVEARSPERLERVFQASVVLTELRCTREATTLSCRGPLDDSRAASKGLVALTRASFARPLRRLSGAE